MYVEKQQGVLKMRDEFRSGGLDFTIAMLLKEISLNLFEWTEEELEAMNKRYEENADGNLPMKSLVMQASLAFPKIEYRACLRAILEGYIEELEGTQ